MISLLYPVCNVDVAFAGFLLDIQVIEMFVCERPSSHDVNCEIVKFLAIQHWQFVCCGRVMEGRRDERQFVEMLGI